MTARIVVVGGGVIGTATAWRLAQAGAQVTLVEANALASGTSSTSFAWLNANGKPPLAYHRLNWAGVAEHTRLREEFGNAPWLHTVGNLTWEEPSRVSASEPNIPIRGERLMDRVQRLREWNYPLDVLDRRTAERWFPELALPGDVDRFVHYPAEGYADVPLLVGALSRAAVSHGATIITHDPVCRLLRDGDRVTGVEVMSGSRLQADRVVCCTGRWTESLLFAADIAFAMNPTRGLLAYTSPIGTSHRSLVHSPQVNLRPDGGSRFVLANYDMDDQLSESDTAETVRNMAVDLLQRASTVLPAMRGSRIEAVRIGIRSIPADGFPVVGAMPGVEGLHLAVTHSGVTMGPLLGRLVAHEVLTGSRDERLAPFRLERLSATT